MKLRSRIVRRPTCNADQAQSSSTPIYQTATFGAAGNDFSGGYDYTRSGNPTRDVLSTKIADLQSGVGALAYASGMAAINAVLSLVPQGGRVVAAADLYGGSFRLLSRLKDEGQIDLIFVDISDLRSVESQLSRDADLLLIETPSNPRHHIADLRALAALCQQHEVIFAADNSLMSPWLQRPLELGCDLVIESATKFLCGHADITAGIVACRDEQHLKTLQFHHNATGCGLAPFESWLLLRGLETLAVRVDAQQRSALKLAEFLKAHPKVAKVYYVGLESHPDFVLHASQASGPGSVLSFEAKTPECATRVIEETRLFATTVSFGSVRSTISRPATMSHASVPEHLRAQYAPNHSLIRISVGLEDVDELLADLKSALEAPAKTGELCLNEGTYSC